VRFLPGELAAIRLHHTRLVRDSDRALPAALGTRLGTVETLRLPPHGMSQQPFEEGVDQRSGLMFDVHQSRLQIRSLLTVSTTGCLPTKLPTGLQQPGPVGLGQTGRMI
jgi:hypothetical protein